MTDSVRHLFSTGHFVVSLQLHCFSLVLVVSFARIFLLCLDMILSMFSVQEYDIFMVHLFSIGWRGLFTGKCLSTRRKNCLPMSVLTSLL